MRQSHDEATKIVAELIAKLAHHSPPPDTPTVAHWGRGFDRYLNTDDRRISKDLIREAQQLYNDLVASQRKTMLLHGDLQHYNVLYDHERGWTASDPKGVVGELEYEVGALLRNPVELPELFTQRATAERRLEILARLLPLDRSRVLRWCFAQAVLSAIWSVEDGYERNYPALELARTVRSMIV